MFLFFSKLLIKLNAGEREGAQPPRLEIEKSIFWGEVLLPATSVRMTPRWLITTKDSFERVPKKDPAGGEGSCHPPPETFWKPTVSNMFVSFVVETWAALFSDAPMCWSYSKVACALNYLVHIECPCGECFMSDN